MITDIQKKIIRDTWRLVLPIADTVADLFYERLFDLRPEYRALFKSDMAGQKKKLLAMLSFIVKSLDWPESAWRETVSEESDLFLIMLALGRRHTSLYRVPDEGYTVVGEALLWTLDYGLGKKFDEPAREAWTQVYKLVSLTMKMGHLSVQTPEQTELATNDIVRPAVLGDTSIRGPEP
ncbi:globin domain-containing protein [Pendulispora albinea]|uniref:Globin domain-containing protein n=1 Tax=Pendulispora albinea TaxID=2741071 RepID=A0ABZ2LLC0_9BACT